MTERDKSCQNTRREVACESNEGIKLHTVVLEVLPRINEFDPAHPAVAGFPKDRDRTGF